VFLKIKVMKLDTINGARNMVHGILFRASLGICNALNDFVFANSPLQSNFLIILRRFFVFFKFFLFNPKLSDSFIFF